MTPTLLAASALALLAELPAVPTDKSGRYVAAAYLVFFVLIAVYVAIMAQRLRRIARMADDLQQRLDERPPEDEPRP